MSWNNGYERRKFEAQQKKQADEYRKAGMTETQIAEMYQFDLQVHRQERILALHTQPMQERIFNKEGNDESDNCLLAQNLEVLSSDDEGSEEHSRYWWIDQIDDPVLCSRIKKLPLESIELLTLIAYEGFNGTEVAKAWGVSKMAISKRWKKIKKFLE